MTYVDASIRPTALRRTMRWWMLSVASIIVYLDTASLIFLIINPTLDVGTKAGATSSLQ